MSPHPLHYKNIGHKRDFVPDLLLRWPLGNWPKSNGFLGLSGWENICVGKQCNPHKLSTQLWRMGLLGGQVDFMCDQTTNTTSQIKGGKVKAYAVTSKTRVASLPDLPTMDESGLKGFEVGIWHGVWAPKSTPKPIIDKLNAALNDALNDADLKKKFADLGTVPEPVERRKPEVLRAHLSAEIAKWGPIIKKAGIYAD